ncbi:MAG: ATP-binding protein [Ruminococcus sp.]
MRADALPRAVLEQLRELDCVLPGQTVCCALSGGADSVCLLRCLLELRQRLGITVTAVHVNHPPWRRERPGCAVLPAALCGAGRASDSAGRECGGEGSGGTML